MTSRTPERKRLSLPVPSLRGRGLLDDDIAEPLSGRSTPLHEVRSQAFAGFSDSESSDGSVESPSSQTSASSSVSMGSARGAPARPPGLFRTEPQMFLERSPEKMRVTTFMIRCLPHSMTRTRLEQVLAA